MTRRDSLNGVHETLGQVSAKIDGLRDSATEREAAASIARIDIHKRIDLHSLQIEGVATRVDVLESDRDRAAERLIGAEKRTAWRFKALTILVGTVGLFGPLVRAYIVAHV